MLFLSTIYLFIYLSNYLFNLTVKEKKRKGDMRNIAGGFRWNYLSYSPSVIKKRLLNYTVALEHI